MTEERKSDEEAAEPMKELIERLEGFAALDDGASPYVADSKLIDEAVAEIKHLRAVLAGAERALSRFLAHQLSHDEKYLVLRAARDNARAALAASSRSKAMTEERKQEGKDGPGQDRSRARDSRCSVG